MKRAPLATTGDRPNAGLRPSISRHIRLYGQATAAAVELIFQFSLHFYEIDHG